MLRSNSKSYLQRVVNYSNIARAPAEVFAAIQTRRGDIYSSNIFLLRVNNHLGVAEKLAASLLNNSSAMRQQGSLRSRKILPSVRNLPPA